MTLWLIFQLHHLLYYHFFVIYLLAHGLVLEYPPCDRWTCVRLPCRVGLWNFAAYLLDVLHWGVGVSIGRQVHLLGPWWAGRTYLYFWVVGLVVAANSLTRDPRESLWCLLVKDPYQTNEQIQ